MYIYNYIKYRCVWVIISDYGSPDSLVLKTSVCGVWGTGGLMSDHINPEALIWDDRGVDV